MMMIMMTYDVARTAIVPSHSSVSVIIASSCSYVLLSPLLLLAGDDDNDNRVLVSII